MTNTRYRLYREHKYVSVMLWYAKELSQLAQV